jgi:flavin-dependent dehydrogenase
VDGDDSVETPLPFEGWSLSRLRLDTALRDGAAAAGADLRLGTPVRQVRDGAVLMSGGGTLPAGPVVLATGKHDLRGHGRSMRGGRRMVGFKLHLRPAAAQAAALAGSIELHLFDGGYAGLQPVEDGAANLSLVIEEQAFLTAGSSFEGVLEALAPTGSALAARLANHAALWRRPLAVAGIPYGFRVWRGPPGPAWLWSVGDQATVIPSFTGDGIALSLHSAELAAETLLGGGSPRRYVRTLGRHVARPMAVAALLDALLAAPRARRAAFGAARRAPGLLRLCPRLTRNAAGLPSEAVEA